MAPAGVDVHTNLGLQGAIGVQGFWINKIID
jgi:hypothetical protein